jgi:hypothetical protein
LITSSKKNITYKTKFKLGSKSSPQHQLFSERDQEDFGLAFNSTTWPIQIDSNLSYQEIRALEAIVFQLKQHDAVFLL